LGRPATPSQDRTHHYRNASKKELEFPFPMVLKIVAVLNLINNIEMLFNLMRFMGAFYDVILQNRNRRFRSVRAAQF